MSKAKPEEKEPIFLAYGHAVYAAQLFESAMRVLIEVINAERHQRGFTKSQIDLDQPDTQKTMGSLFNDLLKVEYFTTPEKNSVHKAIKERNILIHSYWRNEKIICATLTPTGREWLIKDLYEKKELFRKVDDIVSSFIDAYLKKYGLSVEAIAMPSYITWVNDNEPPEDVLH